MRALLFSSCGAPRALHSFPTRRSSDLGDVGAARDRVAGVVGADVRIVAAHLGGLAGALGAGVAEPRQARSEEHTSELQSRLHLVCRLLLEKKNKPTRR